MLLAQAAAEGTGILCTLLLIATIIAFIVGFAQALGFIGGRAGTPAGRYGTLVLAVILLIVYVVLC